MYSYGPPRMAEQKQDDQFEHTYSSYVRIRDVALKTCQWRWNDREKWLERVRDIYAGGTTWWWWWWWYQLFTQKRNLKNTFSKVEIRIKQFWKVYLTAKLYKIQFLPLFPFNDNTSTHLFLIESINFVIVSDEILFQYYSMQDFVVSLTSNGRLFLHTVLDKINLKFSIGFISGDLVASPKTSLSFVLNQYFVSLEMYMAAFSS